MDLHEVLNREVIGVEVLPSGELIRHLEHMNYILEAMKDHPLFPDVALEMHLLVDSITNELRNRVIKELNKERAN